MLSLALAVLIVIVPPLYAVNMTSYNEGWKACIGALK